MSALTEGKKKLEEHRIKSNPHVVHKRDTASRNTLVFLVSPFGVVARLPFSPYRKYPGHLLAIDTNCKIYGSLWYGLPGKNDKPS